MSHSSALKGGSGSSLNLADAVSPATAHGQVPNSDVRTRMEDKAYETFEHTADIGLRARGKCLEDLFANAACGMFETLTDLPGVRPTVKQEIRLEAVDLAELMVSWLNELLFRWESEQVLFSRFEVHDVKETGLAATIWGEPYDSERHEIFGDIKAATYHNLYVVKEGKNWLAEIVLDI